MNREQLFTVVRELDLPRHEYAIFGGACLTAHNIRETEDLEIFVTDNLYQTLVQEGWDERVTFSTNADYVTEMVQKVAVLAFRQCGSDKWIPDVDTYIRSPELIDGVLFMPLEAMRAWKAKTARPKDLVDVGLIGNYLDKL
jgi:hypothetical protein